jgi:uncharacterized protein YjgD (DUF1641 family)
MAVAVDFRSFTPVDARVDLIKKVEGAPVEHAEAVLAAYELLQQLHEKGILELLTGLLTAGETVVNHVVGIISSPQAVTATRLGLMMVNMLGSIDADKISRRWRQAARSRRRCWRWVSRRPRRKRGGRWRLGLDC